MLIIVLNGLIAFFGEPSRSVDMTIEANKSSYVLLMHKIFGKNNAYKTNSINDLVKEVNDANNKILKKADKYESGEISQTDYIDYSFKLSEILSQKDIVERINSQKEYVTQDQKHRYYIYENGWTNLLQNTGIDILLFIFILLSITPIFCNEYETGMNELNLISSGGYKCLYANKILAGISITSLLSIILSAENICINNWRFGLDGTEYPLQSLRIFEDFATEISIKNWLILYVLLGMMSAIYISILVMFLSVITRKVVNTILITISILFFPLFVLEEINMYKIPLPINFLRKQGYILGIYSSQTGKNEFFNINEIMRILISTLIICIILIIIGKKFYGNIRKIKVIRKYRITYAFMIITLLFTGCEKKENTSEHIFNNIGWGMLFVYDNNVIKNVDNQIQLKKNKNNVDLIRDPFMKGKQRDMKINGMCGNLLYITMEYDTGDYDIISVNTNNYESKIIYKKHWNFVDGYNYLGIKSENLNSNSIQNSERVSTCFYENKKLYILSDEYLYETDCKTGKRKIIIEDVNDSVISYINGRIYYVNKTFNLMSYNVKNKKTEVVDSGLVTRIFALKNDILIQYTSKQIVARNYKTGEVNFVYNSYGEMFNADEKNIYCVKENKEIEVINVKTGVIEKNIKVKGEVNDIKSLNDGSKFYVVIYDGKQFKIEEF